MVFSFFKKDPKAAKGGTGRPTPSGGAARPVARPTAHDARTLSRPLPGPVNRSLNRTSTPASPSFATTENAIPERELARSLAMATAAKIDAIESEMSRDFLRPRGSPMRDNVAANSVMTAPPVTEQPAEAEPELDPVVEMAAPVAEEPFDPGEDATSYGIEAIELGTADSSSALDETAILFANGQDQAAEAVLRSAMDSERLGPSTERGWLMMFEFLQQRGDKAGFERLTMQYALRFEHSAPGWLDYEPAGPRNDTKTDSPAVKLPESVGANIVKPLEHLKALAMTHASLTLDVSGARTIDAVGAELLLRVFNAFKRASHELIVQGAEQLLNPLRSAIEPGRRDTADACWMLLLDVQRLLNRQHDFEETGIQYCITYEVSPPSWEPCAPNIKTRAAAQTVSSASDPLDWRGEIGADGEPLFSRMMASARSQNRIAIECRYLRRMAFSAASSLLGHVIKLQQLGTSVEFRNVNALVGVLLQLLGVAAVADVQLRRN